MPKPRYSYRCASCKDLHPIAEEQLTQARASFELEFPEDKGASDAVVIKAMFEFCRLCLQLEAIVFTPLPSGRTVPAGSSVC